MKCYSLKANRKYKRIDYSPSTSWSKIVCPLEDGHQRAGPRIGDLHVALPPKKAGDFIWTSLLGELIINDKVLNVLKKNDVTGYEVFPVTIDDDDRENNTRLWEFRVTGWGGVAPEKSGIILDSECPGCGHLVYKLFKNPEYLFDESQWDGSDFFMIWPLPRYVFINERVTTILQSENITGFTLMEPSLFPIDESGGSTLSPGRLSRYMNKERSLEIGKPLGIY